MRILHAWTSTPESVGLSDRYWLDETHSYHAAAARLAHDGHVISQCVLSLGARRSAVRDGVTYEFFPCDEPQLPVRRQSSRSFLDFVAGASADVLVVHLLNRQLTDQLLALDAPRTKRILHCNTYCLPGSTFKFLAANRRSLSGVIANAPSLLDAIVDQLSSNDLPSLVLPSAVDPRQFRPLPLDKRWDLIWTGQMRRGDAKQLEQLIHVAAAASASLAIVGDGDARPDLEQLARAHEPRVNVEFLGWRPRVELPELLNQARAYATTAAFDPAPRGVTEAMACGLPIVGLSTCRGLEQQVLPGQNGFLADDAAHLAQLVRKLLGDSRMREVLGSVSRRIALRTFHPRRRHRRLSEFLARIVG